eukprot:TRINITY_DN4388_c0_g1_i1.p1 TRINITY_DN4388_c0_g1~~TRINITY_DN4388_c0_g1_i1.p1  ORF type:complete len:401 (-),score=115.30 TRINITY_DN4388_c0_g1_i1:101-1303(-)
MSGFLSKFLKVVAPETNLTPEMKKKKDFSIAQDACADGNLNLFKERMAPYNPHEIIHFQNESRNSFIHIAASHGQIGIIQYLRNFPGFDEAISSPGSRGNYPIHFAALRNKFEMVKLLLELGADVASKNGRGESPYQVAVGHPEIRRHLIVLSAKAEPHTSQEFINFHGEAPTENAVNIAPPPIMGMGSMNLNAETSEVPSQRQLPSTIAPPPIVNSGFNISLATGAPMQVSSTPATTSNNTNLLPNNTNSFAPQPLIRKPPSIASVSESGIAFHTVPSPRPSQSQQQPIINQQQHLQQQPLQQRPIIGGGMPTFSNPTNSNYMANRLPRRRMMNQSLGKPREILPADGFISTAKTETRPAVLPSLNGSKMKPVLPTNAPVTTQNVPADSSSIQFDDFTN